MTTREVIEVVASEVDRRVRRLRWHHRRHGLFFVLFSVLAGAAAHRGAAGWFVVGALGALASAVARMQVGSAMRVLEARARSLRFLLTLAATRQADR